MPLPPALRARLAKRGIIKTQNQSFDRQNKENFKEDEEIIAENYDEESRVRKEFILNSIPTSYDSDSKSQTENKFKGHPGCPNKYNVWHVCTKFCKDYWGEGHKKPKWKYMYFKRKMLETYPLPENWVEVYDPGTGRFYYWDEENDVVSWLPPSHPRALITDSAAHFREERHMVESEKYDKGKKSESDNDSGSDSNHGSISNKRHKKRYGSTEKDSDKSDEEKYTIYKPPVRNERIDRVDRSSSRRKVKENDIDPMDPAAYSNIPRGSWSDGLNKGLEAKTGADITASGPLYQMRPYPNPGAVLRANAKKSD